MSRLATFGLALSVAIPAHASGQTTVAFEELLLELSAESEVLGFVDGRTDASGRVLVSLRAVLDHVSLRVGQIEAGRRVIAFFPDQSLLEVDTRARLMKRGDLEWTLDAADAAWDGDELYLRAERLADLLAVIVTVNRDFQSLSLTAAAHLPAVMRASRVRARARSTRFERVTQPAVPFSRSPGSALDRVLGGAVVDWQFTVGNSVPEAGGGLETDFGAMRLAAGADLFGGGAVLRHDSRWTPSGGNTSFTDFSWLRAWPEDQWVRQARVGRVRGTGLRPQPITGVAITNAPFVRPATFGVGMFDGGVPEGWEVEMYRNGRLLGTTVADPTGRYGLNLPVRYGSNPITVMAYGPYGEAMRFERTFEIPFERLPVGDVEYGVSAGACRITECDAQGNVDARWGANDWLTLRGGTEFVGLDTGDRWYPYVGLAAQPFRPVSLSADYEVNSLATARAQFAPSGSFRTGASLARSVGEAYVPGLAVSSRRQQINGYLFFRPGGYGSRYFGRLEVDLVEGVDYDSSGARATASGQFRRVRFDLGARLRMIERGQATTATNYLFARAFFQLGGWAGPFDRATGRTAVEFEPSEGLRTVSALVTQRFGTVQLDLSGGWDRFRSAFVSLAFRAEFSGGRFFSRNSTDASGFSATQTLEGSMLFGRTGDFVDFHNGRSVGRAGVSGVAFLDANGNGRLDQGESVMEGVRIRVGPWQARTDEFGHYGVWDIVPFETMYLEVDPGSTRNAQWTPVATRYSFSPDPNRFLRFDIPFVRTREVSGVVRMMPDGAVLGGVEIIVEPIDGGESYVATTFSDGGFYLMSVRPGSYRASLTPEFQDILGVSAEADFFDVPADGDEEIEGVEVRLRRR